MTREDSPVLMSVWSCTDEVEARKRIERGYGQAHETAGSDGRNENANVQVRGAGDKQWPHV